MAINIVLLSPFPPAQNPRLVKEYQALKANNFKVKVYYAERDLWSSLYREKNNPDFICVGGKYGSFYYYLTRFIHKILKNLLPFAFAYHRVSWLLYLKAIANKADFYIAHNLAALPIAVMAAKFYQTKAGFDAEDFHRQEVTDNQLLAAYKIAKHLEDKYLCQTNYITAASPLIAAKYKQLYPNLNPIVINNVFEKTNISTNIATTTTNKLSLFWFSQTIGKMRGLELVIQAIGLLKNKNINISLLGNISVSDKIYFKTLANTHKMLQNQLIFLAPTAPKNIFKIAAQHDIGLALELHTPLNRNICLTNKIFTYLTAGIAIIASETDAQKQFITQYPLIGKLFTKGNATQLAKVIQNYFEHPELLLQTKENAKLLAKNKLNWELESQKFIALIN